VNAPNAIKPRVRPLANGGAAVVFPCGGRAEIYPVHDRGQIAGWSFSGVRADGTETSGRGPWAHDPARAPQRAWCETIARPAPISTPIAEIHALATAVDRGSSKDFAAALRRILFERTGVRFSVRKGTGTGSSWVRVRPEGDYEAAVLASVFSDAHGGDLSIRPCGGERLAVICIAAGVDTPEGFKVRAPDWD
jgi:hypothetical protein